MVKKAIITVKSSVSVEDESIEVVTPGEFYVNKDGFKVKYDETKLSGMEGTKTTMIIKEKCFELIRCGTTETKMIFERNKQSVTLYKTPYGVMGVIIDTKKLEINMSENGGTIDIVYTLNIENQQKIETILNINIKM